MRIVGAAVSAARRGGGVAGALGVSIAAAPRGASDAAAIGSGPRRVAGAAARISCGAAVSVTGAGRGRPALSGIPGAARGGFAGPAAAASSLPRRSACGAGRAAGDAAGVAEARVPGSAFAATRSGTTGTTASWRGAVRAARATGGGATGGGPDVAGGTGVRAASAAVPAGGSDIARLPATGPSRYSEGPASSGSSGTGANRDRGGVSATRAVARWSRVARWRR